MVHRIHSVFYGTLFAHFSPFKRALDDSATTLLSRIDMRIFVQRGCVRLAAEQYEAKLRAYARFGSLRLGFRHIPR